jgi:hypothetical protein
VHAAQWTSVKPAERALEKLVRSYDLDPSRLLDACRETLAYDRPAEIAAALDAISADGELVVVRVKNRLDPHPEKRACWKWELSLAQEYPIKFTSFTFQSNVFGPLHHPRPLVPTSIHTRRETQQPFIADIAFSFWER